MEVPLVAQGAGEQVAQLLLLGPAQVGDAQGVSVQAVAQYPSQVLAGVGEDQLLDPAVVGVGLACDQAAALESARVRT
jgi:hypothetical protein